MNYNDSILENKTFSFFKKLIYNIAVAICIMLLLVIVLVYGFKFQLYNVLSDSEYPNFVSGDMIVAVPQKEYELLKILQQAKNIIFAMVMRLVLQTLQIMVKQHLGLQIEIMLQV